jgi:hypothetical protein
MLTNNKCHKLTIRNFLRHPFEKYSKIIHGLSTSTEMILKLYRMRPGAGLEDKPNMGSII